MCQNISEFISDNREDEGISRQINFEQEIDNENLEHFASKELEVFEAFEAHAEGDIMNKNNEDGILA